MIYFLILPIANPIISLNMAIMILIKNSKPKASTMEKPQHNRLKFYFKYTLPLATSRSDYLS